VCMSEDDATAAIRAMLSELEFGEAGREVVIEEYMEGEELSVFAVTDGERCLILTPSQDHKRVGEGDTGPNTGGMGAYAPVAIATPELIEEARRSVFEPTLKALSADGCPFQGLLYAGLMITDDGLRVVEFNCRFGDPETQVVLPLMDSSLLEILATVADGGSLAGRTVRQRDEAAVTTVIASEGYPGPYAKGRSVAIPAELEGEKLFLFHAGTGLVDGNLVTSGGRVLAVTALADDVIGAAEASRGGASRIAFEGAFFRRDIGWREAARRTVS